ncbi:DedA family protein [Barrientosiimonas endolithica]|uniref:Membrane protein n=1 Tax=Barrientosiimonas endolithica TaxID=1535208 RepID=A0ABM8HFL6_9MICO|nr:DedA family protein [Barrientosiimonas endolithica]BDZ59822.1 membrane protein [Barrientosiimonas endolithica]
MLDQLNQLITDHAAATWVLPVIFSFAMLDGLFPPLPSESLLIALAAVGAASGAPNLVALAVVAAVGAWLGDNLAYAIGRRIDADRLSARSPRLARARVWAEGQLERRGGVIILVARYIPVGRVAVNLTAGSTGYSRRRFAGLTALSCTTWATYSVALGALAGHWVERNPLLGAAIGIALAVSVGLLIERLLARLLPATVPTDGAADVQRERVTART